MTGALPGSARRLATARSIAAAQQLDGAIPWEPGRHTDPWDHVECVMALNVAGATDPDLRPAARRGLAWLAATQRADGTWSAGTRLHRDGARRDEPGHAHVESNYCAYPAVGLAHHVLATGRGDDARRWWPMVARGLDAVVGMQRVDGTIAWGRGPGGDTDDALLAGCASILLSLRAGTWLAELVGESVPDWELAAARLAHVVVTHPERFADRSRFSMDWYYPVLGGALAGTAGRAHLATRWHEFVVAEGGLDLGIRCVADQPWVTGAETCELALALHAVGARDEAIRMVAAMQHLRHDDGSYWTGYVWPDDARWPIERTTWTGAAMVLACDALEPRSDASALFAGALPAVVPVRSSACADAACPA